MSDPRVALVTGASRGIGKAIALELARAGFAVAVTARTVRAADERGLPGNLDATVTEIEQEGGRAFAVAMDLTDSTSMDAAVTAVLEQAGRIDVLVNNGFYQTGESLRPFLDQRFEHIEKQVSANLLAPMRLARLVLPSMLERGDGAIVNLVSAAGLGDPAVPAGQGGWGMGYGTSKGGLVRVAGILAVELGGQGIRAFSVEPGLVATEQYLVGVEAGQFELEGSVPPATAARAVAWLVTSPDAVALNCALVSAPELVEHRALV